MSSSVPLSCPAILAAVAAVALKSLVESIRLEVSLAVRSERGGM